MKNKAGEIITNLKIEDVRVAILNFILSIKNPAPLAPLNNPSHDAAPPIPSYDVASPLSPITLSEDATSRNEEVIVKEINDMFRGLDGVTKAQSNEFTTVMNEIVISQGVKKSKYLGNLNTGQINRSYNSDEVTGPAVIDRQSQVLGALAPTAHNPNIKDFSSTTSVPTLAAFIANNKGRDYTANIKDFREVTEGIMTVKERAATLAQKEAEKQQGNIKKLGLD